MREGYYHNDPTYPPPPRDFTDPVINLGPDADAYRDPADGRIKDASEEGVRFGTFTAHRSPLGLVFDVDHALAEPFQRRRFHAQLDSRAIPTATDVNWTVQRP